MQKPYQLTESSYRESTVQQIKALSVKQPWAWLIVNGYKDFENRTWQTSFRGEILIHAGKTPVPNWKEICIRLKEEKGIDIPHTAECGALVGMTRVTDCVPMDKADMDSDKFFWFQGPFGWKVEQSKPFETIIPYHGKLGLFNVPLVGPVAEAVNKLTKEKHHGIIQ